jgi:hypothetical protein
MSQKPAQKTKNPARQAYWMRAVRFAGLHRVLHLVASYSDGIRVRDLNKLIVANGLYRTDRGEPAKSTLYHCRNTLVHLGILRRRHQGLVAATDDMEVDSLLHEAAPSADTLSETARETFARLVLANHDCFQNFFGLFLLDSDVRSPEQFRAVAAPVIWLEAALDSSTGTVESRFTAGSQRLVGTKTGKRKRSRAVIRSVQSQLA